MRGVHRGAQLPPVVLAAVLARSRRPTDLVAAWRRPAASQLLGAQVIGAGIGSVPETDRWCEPTG
jgi:hypothetical protein